jgi:uncharacterized repeat protein (TIGR01451 family)
VAGIGFSVKGLRSGAAALALGLCAVALPAAAQTRAGTQIPNTARLSLNVDGTAGEALSNLALVRVAEVLDLTLAPRAEQIALMPGQSAAAPFTLTNDGNGQEAFALSALFAAGTVGGFAIDADGDGQFDPAIDTPLANAATPMLAPGQTVQLLALVGSATGAVGTLRVTARAVTAAGRAGDVAAGQGDGGTDAVVGRSTASATLTFSVAPGSGVEPVLEKSQSVRDPNGGSMPVYGAVVTYSLVARLIGPAWDATVADTIPAGTAYVPGSITLDGAPLADADAFDGSTVRVWLGDSAGPATRTIQFKVTIQ